MYGDQASGNPGQQSKRFRSRYILIRSTLIPLMAAICGFWDTARMDFPSLEYFRNRCSTPMMKQTITKEMILLMGEIDIGKG